jgi:hypothetical protein
MLLKKSVSILVCVFSFYGCVAGKAEYYVPTLEQSYGNTENSFSYKCGNYIITLDSFCSDGFMLMYYLIPLAPIPPDSKTKTDLEIQITISSKVEPVFDLTLNDIQVKIPGTEGMLFPYKILIISECSLPEEPWFRKTFRFLFHADRHKISKFTLTFPHKINGCDLPPVNFCKEIHKYYMTPINE